MSNTYTVTLLVGQRLCDYPGQYAPEVLAAADEYTESDNPDYLNSEERRTQESQEFAALARINVALDYNELLARLWPEDKPIQGKIV